MAAGLVCTGGVCCRGGHTGTILLPVRMEGIRTSLYLRLHRAPFETGAAHPVRALILVMIDKECNIGGAG